MKKKNAPPEAILKTLAEWRSPRPGRTNPDILTNEAWSWIVRERIGAYFVDKALRHFDPKNDGPAWCFDRYAASVTELGDGTKIHIGGAHEDHYDADFHIYNDVVVETVDGGTQIYGYPYDVFPPTDHHSATLVGHSIYIVGNVGHMPEEVSSSVPVYVLELDDFSIRRVSTGGQVPLGLSGHEAALTQDGKCIQFCGGSISHPNWSSVDNIDTWELSLATSEWTRLTKRPWQRRVLFRKPWKPNQLYEIGQLAYAYESGRWSRFALEMKSNFENDGHLPDLDLYKKRYVPPISHTPLDRDQDEFRVHRIAVDGVSVVYREDHEGIYITVEGELPLETTNAIFSDALTKLSVLENTPYAILQLND